MAAAEFCTNTTGTTGTNDTNGTNGANGTNGTNDTNGTTDTGDTRSTTGMPPPGNWKGWPWDFSAFPHVDYGPQLNYAVWLLTALAAAFLALRVYCKFLRHRGLWWDDHTLIASWIALVVQTALITYNTTIGYGQHIWDFHPTDLSTFLLVSKTSGFFSILAAMLSKTSFAITVLRISDGWIKRFVWVIIVSINLTLGFGALLTYIQCMPTEKLWNPSLEGKCWPKETIIKYHMFAAAYSAALDIILGILPWRIIWKLTMNKKEKFAVLLAMNMGVFAGAMSIAKMTQLPSINKFDPINRVWLSFFGTAESAVTIMAACIPVLRALISSAPPRAPPVNLYHIDSNRYARSPDLDMEFSGGTTGGAPPSSPLPGNAVLRAPLSEEFSWDEKKLEEGGWVEGVATKK